MSTCERIDTDIFDVHRSRINHIFRPAYNPSSQSIFPDRAGERMSGPIATAVSAIFGLEASVASFVASIVTGTISGGIQVHDESGFLGRGTGGIVSLASILASVLSGST